MEKMQPAISALVELGPLPNSTMATVPAIQAFEKQLSKINSPVTDGEACALVRLFGPDDCFGLAWTLLHLIETAPNWPCEGAFDGLQGEWIDRLRKRSRA